MKHLRKIFENNEDDKKYIEECFLDISENSNFKVELIESEGLVMFGINPKADLKLHIELGKSLSIPQPVNSNLYVGMVEVDLEFLRNKNKAMLDLLDDIEVAIDRIKDRFQNAEIKVETNRREEINILVSINN
jgi:hypothetical protein